MLLVTQVMSLAGAAAVFAVPYYEHHQCVTDQPTQLSTPTYTHSTNRTNAAAHLPQAHALVPGEKLALHALDRDHLARLPVDRLPDVGVGAIAQVLQHLVPGREERRDAVVACWCGWGGHVDVCGCGWGGGEGASAEAHY